MAVLACAQPATAAIPDTPDPPGYNVDGPVYAIARLGDTIYIGGSFAHVNGQSRANLAAISAVDGSLTSWAPATSGEVDALAVSGSTVYVGGQFTSVDDGSGATARNGLAALDASSGALSSWNPNPDNAFVKALVVNGSQIYVGGIYTSIGGQTRSDLAEVDRSSGFADASWAPDPNGEVDELVLSPDRSILYVGGWFIPDTPSTPNIGGQPRYYVAALNTATGAADPNWNPANADGSNDGAISAMALSPDGSALYLSGDFFDNSFSNGAVMGGATRYYVAAVDGVGFGDGTGRANSFAPDPDNQADAIAATASSVYLGGSWTCWDTQTTICNGGSIPRNNLGAFDPLGVAIQAWPAQTDGSGDVYALTIAADGSLYVGGSFSTLGGSTTANNFATFTPPPASTSAPAISGTPLPNQTLTCVNGTWSGGMPQTYAAQFLHDGSPVGPADAHAYTVDPGDVGHTIACRVTATNRVGSASADSAPVTITAPAAAQTPPPAAPPPPGLAPPVLLRSVDLIPTSGTVLVKRPGDAAFIRIQDASNVPVGTIVDVTHGVVQLVSAANQSGKTQTGTFYGGLFKIIQLPGSPPITELVLVGGNFKVCQALASGAPAEAAKKRPRSIRHLWAEATGSFRTKGRFAAATVRGTKWLTDDRCDGTLVRVVKGAVTVRDLVRRRTLPLRAGHQYVALAPRKRH